MMRNALVVVLLLGFASQAHADPKTKWKVVLGTSLVVAAGGGWLAMYETMALGDVRDEQCDHGVDPVGENQCMLQAGAQPWTNVQIAESNERGDRLATRANMGWGIAGLGLVGVGVATVKLLTLDDDKPDRAMAIAPTVNKHGAGAALTLRW
jgi:hypothetical protein